jgi:hypothetical protein
MFLKLHSIVGAFFCPTLGAGDCIFIYVILLGAASAYAALLSTRPGRKFADERSAESVILGVGLVLAALRLLLPGQAWGRVVVSFIVAGTPMISRSLLKRFSG